MHGQKGKSEAASLNGNDEAIVERKLIFRRSIKKALNVASFSYAENHQPVCSKREKEAGIFTHMVYDAKAVPKTFQFLTNSSLSPEKDGPDIRIGA